MIIEKFNCKIKNIIQKTNNEYFKTKVNDFKSLNYSNPLFVNRIINYMKLNMKD